MQSHAYRELLPKSKFLQIELLLWIINHGPVIGTRFNAIESKCIQSFYKDNIPYMSLKRVMERLMVYMFNISWSS